MRGNPATRSASARRGGAFWRLLPRLAALCCAGCVSVPAAAEGINSWFRVELLAFAYSESAASAAESWPAHPPLYYPASLVRLSSPEIAEMRRVLPLIAGRDRARGWPTHPRLYSSASLVRLISSEITEIAEMRRVRLLIGNETPTWSEPLYYPAFHYPAFLDRLGRSEIAEMRRVLLLIGRDRARGAIPRTTLRAEVPLDHAWVMPPPAAQGMVRWGDREEVLAETPILGVGLPFVLLPPPQSLDRLSRRIAQEKGYRVLFRSAWRQPIEENGAATHVLVRGGGVYGRHRELEGSIAIYRKRFVHVETNLWFSSFVSAAEAAPESPQLPPAPRTLFLSTPFLEKEVSIPQVESPVTTAAQPAIELQPPWVQAGEQEGKQTRPEEARRVFREFVRELPSSASVEAPQFAEEGADFAVRRVVVLRQSGRVQNRRSYYFDHPLLGVVVHIVQLH